MSSKSLPAGPATVANMGDQPLLVADDDGHVFYIWSDPRGGINIQGDNESLVVRPRNGRSLRIVAEAPVDE